MPVTEVVALPPLAEPARKLPLTAPAALGANWTVAVHEAPAASDVVQVVAVMDQPVPLRVRVVLVAAMLPVLLMVIVPDFVSATWTLPKARVPDVEMMAAWLAPLSVAVFVPAPVAIDKEPVAVAVPDAV